MKQVLITGGTGTLGHALTERLLKPVPRPDAEPRGYDQIDRLVIYSRSESKQAEMANRFTDPRLRFFIGDVRDEDRLRLAMRGCDTVIHAAALKRIDSCELNPQEAVKTNVNGSLNVMMAAMSQNVDTCCLVSTDKAYMPTTLYGATKAVAEGLWKNGEVLSAGRTRFCGVLYGNVLGSTGSVLTVWEKQLEANEPLSITDPTHTRFWLALADAVDLVQEAIASAGRGEFIIGDPPACSMRDLAEAFAPGHPTKVIGERGVEKRHESLSDSCHSNDPHRQMSIEEIQSLLVRAGCDPQQTDSGLSR